MAKLVNNRQVNVWRGTDAPPTIHHVWIKNDEQIYIYDDEIQAWKSFSEFPDLTVEATETPGVVQIICGNGSIKLAVQGNALGINTNSNGTVTITSNALNNINTEFPLKWDSAEKKLVHLQALEVGIEAGPLTELLGLEAFNVPYIKVDTYGHVVEAASRGIIIPAYVDLTVLDSNNEGTYPIILAPNIDKNEHSGVYKASDMYVLYELDRSEVKHTLVIPNITVEHTSTILGNLVVEGTVNGTFVGNVLGTATPTDHADPNPTYGAASTDLYGHVILINEFPTNDLGQVILNENGTVAVQEGAAASPALVYNTATLIVQLLLDGVIPEIENDNKEFTKLDKNYKFSNDFSELNNKLYINWLEI